MVRHACVLATVTLLWGFPAFAGTNNHSHGAPAVAPGQGAVSGHHDAEKVQGDRDEAGLHKHHGKDQGHHDHGANARHAEHGRHGHHDIEHRANQKPPASPLAERGRQLVVKLHCNACHLVAEGIKHEHHAGHEAIAPNLSFEGEKVKPEWLFDFLKRPHPLRPSIQARMPNFRLSDREALALTEHITTDLRDRALPPLSDGYLVQIPRTSLKVGVRIVSEEYLDCFKCHQQGGSKPQGDPEEWAPDLALARSRLQPEWIVRWLMDPQRIQPGTKMPTYFSDGDSGPDDLLDGDEKRQIIALRDYLLRLGPETNSPGYVGAKKRYPDVTTGDGWALMQKLNCAGCHDIGRMHERHEVAPPLAHEGSRVYREWLVNFLLKPTRIRPVGYIVGAPSRMPDFRLSPHEAEAIAAFLMSQNMPDMPAWWEGSPSPRLVRRGRALYERWNCASCHRGREPNRRGPTAATFEGPDLIRVGQRLKPDHLLFWLRGGSGTVDTHPIVPTLGLTEEQLKAVVAYLTTLR